MSRAERAEAPVMSNRTLVIVTNPGTEKSRSFSALLLGHIQADGMLPCEAGKSTIRPVWLSIGTSEDAMRPFLANLRTGRRTESSNARSTDDRFELLKTAGYHFATQRTSAGMVATAYLPELFRVDPGMVDPSGVYFVALASKSWLAEQENSLRDEIGPAMRHVTRLVYAKRDAYERRQESAGEWAERMRLRELVPMATLFCTYLDRRTHCPLIPDLAFQLQLTMAMLASENAFGWNGYNNQMKHEIDPGMGYSMPIGCSVRHDVFEELLACQVELYMEAKNGKA
jgi:hypothetical protein